MDYGQIKAALELEAEDLDRADLFKKLRLIERGYMSEIYRQRREESNKR
mgnify:CR=1 FL=1